MYDTVSWNDTVPPCDSELRKVQKLPAPFKVTLQFCTAVFADR